MDIRIFSQMIKDRHFTDYKKMKHKYGESFEPFLNTLEELYYIRLPLKDFNGNELVFIRDCAGVDQKAVKLLLQSRETDYGIKAAEDEIVATSAIESIDFTRDSVRRILKGMAPKDELECRISGIKTGLEFISDRKNEITEENLHKLYMMTVGDFLPEEDRLKKGNFYRHDRVFVVSDRVEHSGLDHKRLSQYMREFILFINEDDGINDLIKAAIIHFYMAFIHPYFDGNGRMARLLHLWFLIRKGYRSALFIPFSSLIERSRKEYYGAFTAVTENKEYSRRVDVTPFVLYFTEFVYDKMSRKTDSSLTSSIYDEARRDGIITEKEDRLFKFVMSYYGRDEFSTKQLEKDCGFAAYATIRGFVLKFEKLNLLSVSKYGTRTKYRLSREEVGKMEKRIVVAGSRTFEDYEIAKVFILEVLQSFGEENTFIFLSGKCKGADALGERYAKEQGYEIEAYPADWEKYGRGAGPKRNAEMAKNCDAVICFWDGESKGTKSMIDLAKKHSKEVFIKYIDRA